MIDNTFGLKVQPKDANAQVLKVLKKYRPDSFADIKQDILNGNYALSYSIDDDDGPANIVRCWKELKKLGITAEVYDLGQKTSIQTLKNAVDLYG